MSDVFTTLSTLPGVMDGATVTSKYVLIKCPFHGGGNENTPSCSVSLVKPVYFCHACQTGGNLQSLLTAIGVSAVMADKITSSMSFAVEEADWKKGSFSAFSGKDPFRGKYILEEEILDQYRLAPTDLLQAGFRQKTLKHFEVGFDYDNFRITYPIRNVYGELVGLSGRTVINAEPRYKLYGREFAAEDSIPEDYTMDSVKEAVLWHAHITYPFMWDACEPVIITEGFKAAMWVWQAGFHNVVALIGAYCTEYHVELLARTAAPVFLFLDNNKAGIKGTLNAIKKISNVGANEIYCVRYPDLREQPDDLTVPEIDQAIKQSQIFAEWMKDHKDELFEDAWKRKAWEWGIRKPRA